MEVVILDGSVATLNPETIRIMEADKLGSVMTEPVPPDAVTAIYSSDTGRMFFTATPYDDLLSEQNAMLGML